jgi:hypothetical protein
LRRKREMESVGGMERSGRSGRLRRLGRKKKVREVKRVFLLPHAS